ncbi:UNVERIFIED_CONTAM: hypothetical protein Sindi_0921700 [Sesamum indicum]
MVRKHRPAKRTSRRRVNGERRIAAVEKLEKTRGERIGIDDRGDININCAWEKRRLGHGKSGCFGAAITRVCCALGHGKGGWFGAAIARFAAPLDMEKAAVSAPQLLGFAAPLEPPAIDETEQPRGREEFYAETEKSPEEDVTSPVSLATDARTTGFAEVGVEGLLRKESTLIATDGDLERGPPLGFSSANPNTGCGGVRIPPFNLQEFLRLAYTIIDEGDEVSREALNELKNKWETRFGPETIPKVFPTSMAVRTELHKPTRHVWRSLIPSRALERTSALGSALRNATSDENLPVTRLSDDHSDRVLTETMGRNAGPVSGNFPTDLKEFRPVNTENGMRPARTQQWPDSAEMENDAAADIIIDLSHDTIDDITTDLEHDTAADADADLCDDAGNDTGADAIADFDALHLIDDADEIPRAIWNVRGLNKRDHQLAVKDIIAEFRLQFLGLLETRVRFNNVAAIQSFLLPQWKWFVDYGLVGNRVWIAWYNFLDVDVVECGTQFIHCLVFIRSLHESVALTVIYRASEVADRRELWGALETIAMQNVDVPWLIGGDFNAVRDLSEVCGASGDIRMAMEEFNCCIQNARLLPLPMQGEWYTWHNCSTNPRNLWKRLDRILINDRWMARFPTSSYTSLTP